MEGFSIWLMQIRNDSEDSPSLFLFETKQQKWEYASLSIDPSSCEVNTAGVSWQARNDFDR